MYNESIRYENDYPFQSYYNSLDEVIYPGCRLNLQPPTCKSCAPPTGLPRPDWSSWTLGFFTQVLKWLLLHYLYCLIMKKKDIHQSDLQMSLNQQRTKVCSCVCNIKTLSSKSVSVFLYHEIYSINNIIVKNISSIIPLLRSLIDISYKQEWVIKAVLVIHIDAARCEVGTYVCTPCNFL